MVSVTRLATVRATPQFAFEVGGGFVGKLRWERAAGSIYKLGKPIAPEAIQRDWSKIAGFEKTTHPGDITQSMQPILDNLQSKSRGGNEFIDVDGELDELLWRA